MKVRNRHLLAIGLTIVTTAIGVYLASSRPMIANFNRLEDQRAREDVQRVNHGLDQIVEQLHGKSVDWSNWDDTYRFMQDHNPTYVRSNIVDQSFIDLKIEMIMMLDRSKEMFFSMAVPRVKDFPLLSPKSVRSQLVENGFLDKIATDGPGKQGVILFRDIPVAISVRPIHTTDGKGAFRGWLVFARYLDASVLGELRHVTDQNVSFVPLYAGSSQTSEARTVAESLRSDPVALQPIDKNQLAGYSMIPDIHGRPALILKTTLPRTVSIQGAAMVQGVTWQLLAIGTVFSIIIIFVLEQFALSRLSVLSKQVGNINDFAAGQRVVLKGRDELSFLAQRINEMLGTLENGAHELRESEERLRLHNENLEQTVLERTQLIEHQAFHDKLTSLANRALFTDRLGSALARAQRSRAGTAVLFIDLDNFKLVNDSLGHDLGDDLLVAVAGRLEEAVRPGDTVARLGGDEFTILLENLHEIEEAEAVVERILNNLRRPILLDTRETFASASIGLAFNMGSDSSGTVLLKNADTAMYRAKAAGKSGYVIYDESMNVHAIERLELETELRQALGRGELSVHFQPMIDLATHELRGAEALARWNHPIRGDIAPAEFIPIAEDTGLIISIGYWILERACEQARKWSLELGSNDFVLSVNVSGKQLRQVDVVDRVRDVLERTGLKPSALKLEITESVLMEDRDDVINRMRDLKELGVHLALDDFGTGYSSLSTLLAFPIDTLKIDRSFIRRIGQEEGAMAIIQAIVAIARTMRMDVTGEGVETIGQEELLQSLGCQTGQGFLYDRPLPADAFGARYCIPANAGAPHRHAA